MNLQKHQDHRHEDIYDSLRKPKKHLSLYKALQIGYLRNSDKQAKKLKKFGYRLDKDLSNGEHLVAYHPENKKALYVSNGTQSTPTGNFQFTTDWAHNLFRIGTGTVKNSFRYAREKNAYEKAKQKYNVPTTLVGHSQAGSNVGRIAHSSDHVITLDPALINQKPRSNVDNYRSKGDAVSALANDIKTVDHGHTSFMNPLKAHDISNFKRIPIFI